MCGTRLSDPISHDVTSVEIRRGTTRWHCCGTAYFNRVVILRVLAAFESADSFKYCAAITARPPLREPSNTLVLYHPQRFPAQTFLRDPGIHLVNRLNAPYGPVI